MEACQKCQTIAKTHKILDMGLCEFCVMDVHSETHKYLPPNVAEKTCRIAACYKCGDVHQAEVSHMLHGRHFCPKCFKWQQVHLAETGYISFCDLVIRETRLPDKTNNAYYTRDLVLKEVGIPQCVIDMFPNRPTLAEIFEAKLPTQDVKFEEDS